MLEVYLLAGVSLHSFLILVLIAVMILLIFVGFIYLDRYLSKRFSIKNKTEIDGYTKNYVNKIHERGLFIVDTIMLFVLFFGISIWMLKSDLLLLNIAICILPVRFVFHGLMQWKYPVQHNEYKKSAIYFLTSLLFIPIFLGAFSLLGKL